MGYALCIGECYGCGKRFSFNPVRVPSARDANNVRQPICKMCIDKVNSEKRKMGLLEFDVPSDAYEAVSEEELIY